ncbi:MAG: glycosyltransferase family 2 protein [Actinobacteria bacterium]|nr:glycosyltransferase family 2 protein [Actinomycetota bacterium]
MPKSLALAIPAYNEADGIHGFLNELDLYFKDWDGEVTFVVADDRSTDGMLDVLEELRPTIDAELKVVTTERNGGHGPTVLRAYREAIATGAELTLQVDGDGQFDGRDIRRVAEDLANSGADVAIGARRQREDPWFRKVLTRLLRLFLQQRVGLRVRDPNCPLRAYRSQVLKVLLDLVPPDAAVPNVYLAILAERADLAVAELIVEHRERRGDAAQGTMWGKQQRKVMIPKRLLVFVWRALQECRAFLRTAQHADVVAAVAQARATRGTGESA